MPLLLLLNPPGSVPSTSVPRVRFDARVVSITFPEAYLEGERTDTSVQAQLEHRASVDAFEHDLSVVTA